ncbi:hypothetical protein KUTeg_003549 [Tegillarca granosa]|uniref:PROP1-like PPR domain-containing protein n=1 Tax=Tegillarca granosa TaxID=220873 RepID=A0ABQ9FMH4_TEGGR|nr:hypothetical protein KUTeg_003549 [Tegillarca granosa]
MTNCQILKMFHVGRNLTLTYSVVTVLRQRINHRVWSGSMLGYIRANAYQCNFEHGDRSKEELAFRKEKHSFGRNSIKGELLMEKKLTKRVLTESLIKENEDFKDNFEVLSEEDSFGTLSEDSFKNRGIERFKTIRRKGDREEKESINKIKGRESFRRVETKIDENIGIKSRTKTRQKLETESLSDERKSVKGKYSSNTKLKNDAHKEIQQQHKTHGQTFIDKKQNQGIIGPETRKYNKTENRTASKTDQKHSKQTNKKFSESFGTLNLDNEIKLLTYEEEKSMVSAEEDDEFQKPHQRLLFSRHGHNHMFYARKIMKMDRQGKVSEAISLLEDQMLVEDRVKPSAHEFTLVIGICGRVGYTSKAFSLFNKMKKMALQPEDPTYTALFNACANSPLKGDGLKRAENLRELMAIKGYTPNLVTYKAMMKAFAYCGDMKTAFLIADEASRKFRLDEEFFCHLLFSAVSDKEAGFRHAIQIWRMMRKKGIRPNIYHYNLLLRAVGKCGIGDQDFLKDLIPTAETTDTSLQITSGESVDKTSHMTPSKGIDTSSQTKLLSDKKDTSSTSVVSFEESNLEWWQYDIKTCKPKINVQLAYLPQKLAVNIPDILNPKEKYTQVASLKEIKTREDRMMLLGGMGGYLKRMKADDVIANILTYNQLLEVIPNTEEAEQELFDSMKIANVKPDIDIFNLLILRRFLRKDYLKLWEVRELIKENKLTCSMTTYKFLAHGCRNIEWAEKFLKDMEEAGFEPDIKVMISLLDASYLKFQYKKFLLHQMEKYNIQPDKIFLEMVEKHVIRARKELSTQKGDILLAKQFTKFRHFYDDWLKRMEIQQEKHPWHSFSKEKNQESSFIEM